jgi:transposase-like protein
MGKKRRKHSDEFKAKVALEAVKGVATLSELSSRYKVHPTAISQWKNKLISQSSDIFTRHSGSELMALRAEKEELYKEIGRLQVENNFLKKKV